MKVANYIYATFTLDPTGIPGTTSAQFLDNAEFNLYRLQYDKYRVNSVKVTFIPKANVFDAQNAQADATLNLTGDGAVHSCIDRDGLAPSNTAVISRYPSYRKHDIKKTWSRVYSVKYPTGVWVDCQNQGAFTMVKELGLSGGVTLYAENIVEDNYELWNEPWASVLIEHNIVFQGKTSSSLSGTYDGDGNLVSLTLAPHLATENVALSVLTNVRGTLHDKRTDNEITETAIGDKGND